MVCNFFQMIFNGNFCPFSLKVTLIPTNSAISCHTYGDLDYYEMVLETTSLVVLNPITYSFHILRFSELPITHSAIIKLC